MNTILRDYESLWERCYFRFFSNKGENILTKIKLKNSKVLILMFHKKNSKIRLELEW